MINAQEAKALYDQSCTSVQDYLTYKVENEIIKQAELGKRYYIIHFGSCRGPLPKPSLIVTGVFDKLKRLGYLVRYDFYGEKYVPRGIADDNGDGPMYQSYGIMVGW